MANLSNLADAPSYSELESAKADLAASNSSKNELRVRKALKKCLEEMNWPQAAIDMASVD